MNTPSHPEVQLAPQALRPTSMAIALRDISDALRKYHLIGTLGWQDVAARYKRSRVGAFWLTLNMAVMIATLGLVFGALMKQPLGQFLPYVTAGLIVWGFISTVIIESCSAFTDASGIILQIRMPLFVHLGRVLWKNLIIFGHNFVILPIVLLLFGQSVGLVALLAIPGLILLVLNLGWMMLILSLSCARFRDIAQIVQNGVQVAFYLTPIIWSASIIGERIGGYLYLNPFYSLISIMRDPLLGSAPNPLHWIISAVMALAGWVVALVFYGKKLTKLPYWL